MMNPEYDYHADTSRVSRSMLEVIREDPGLYWAKYVSRTEPPEQTTKARKLGLLVHTMLLEPHLLAERVAVLPKFGRKKLDLEQKALWMKQNAGKMLVTHDIGVKAVSMVEAVTKSGVCDFLRQPGWVCEQPIFWTHQGTGIEAKIKPDMLHVAGRLIVDIKTTEAPSPVGFVGECKKFGYYRQRSMYIHGAQQFYGTDGWRFLFVAIGKHGSHPVGVYDLSQPMVQYKGEQVEIGWAEIDEAFHKLHRCQTTDNWSEEWQRQPVKLELTVSSDYRDSYTLEEDDDGRQGQDDDDDASDDGDDGEDDCEAADHGA